MHTGPAWVFSAALALAHPAEGMSTLALAPVRGDRSGAIHAQLEEALCAKHPCVEAVLRGGLVQLGPTRGRGADAVLVADVRARSGRRTLELALFTTGRRPIRRWALPIERSGRLRRHHVAWLAADVDVTLGDEPRIAPRPDSPAPAAPAPEPPPPPPPAPAPPALQPPPVARAAPPEAAAPGRGPLALPPRRAPPRAAPPPAARRRWLALEIGVETSRRELEFPAGTAPVGYSATLRATPRIRIELHPLAFAGGLGGLALFADGTYQPTFDLPSGARTHPATASRFRAGLMWRIPVATWLDAIPSAGYSRDTFEVGVADGVSLPGFADTRLQGVSGALALEVALIRHLALLAGGGGTWWLEAGELAGGSRFFPGGSAFSAEGEAGLALRFVGPLAVRALAFASTTRWSLDVDPSGAYSVRSARAEAWGGRFSLRVAW